MATEKTREWLSSLTIYWNIRILSIGLLGFSSGLPLLLVMGTLAARLSESGVSLQDIGAFTLVTFAYGFKWLWSPIVDQLPFPLLCRLFGRRRGWMLASQLATAGCILGLGFSNPAESLWATALWAIALSFASATQDIVIDAFRVERLNSEEMGAGAGVIVLGYRLGMVVAGGGALILADLWGWAGAYSLMAALMGVGVLAALILPDPPLPTAGEATPRPSLAEWVRHAVVDPLRDFAARRGWLLILLFIALYKYGDALLSAMSTPFYLQMGFSKTEIGLVTKGFGITFTIIGGLGGGVLVARLGIMRALLVCGVLQAASNLLFAALAITGHNMPVLMATIAVENFTSGMGGAAFVAYLSSLCSLSYTATQYALVSSLMATARTFLASGGGWLAEQMSWLQYFLLTALAALPGLLLLLWLMRLPPAPAGVTADPAAKD